MRISTKGRYGLNAVCYIATSYQGEPISLKNISNYLNIPLPYLEQIVIKLRKAGYVDSIRGAKGGYKLAKSPSEITTYEILTLLEGEMVPIHCKGLDCCDYSESNDGRCCHGEIVWAKINKAVKDAIDNYTLQDLLNDYNVYLDSI